LKPGKPGSGREGGGLPDPPETNKGRGECHGPARFSPEGPIIGCRARKWRPRPAGSRRCRRCRPRCRTGRMPACRSGATGSGRRCRRHRRNTIGRRGR